MNVPLQKKLDLTRLYKFNVDIQVDYKRQIWVKKAVRAVVCLRGGERGTCLGPPLFGGPPLRCYACKFSLVLMKNLLFTHIMY